MFVPINERTLILRKMVREKKVFLCCQRITDVYPNKKNVFMVPNHEKKGDYYMHPYLSQLTDEL